MSTNWKTGTDNAVETIGFFPAYDGIIRKRNLALDQHSEGKLDIERPDLEKCCRLHFRHMKHSRVSMLEDDVVRTWNVFRLTSMGIDEETKSQMSKQLQSFLKEWLAEESNGGIVVEIQGNLDGWLAVVCEDMDLELVDMN